jgi:hypothetical protein
LCLLLGLILVWFFVFEFVRPLIDDDASIENKPECILIGGVRQKKMKKEEPKSRLQNP